MLLPNDNSTVGFWSLVAQRSTLQRSVNPLEGQKGSIYNPTAFRHCLRLVLRERDAKFPKELLLVGWQNKHWCTENMHLKKSRYCQQQVRLGYSKMVGKREQATRFIRCNDTQSIWKSKIFHWCHHFPVELWKASLESQLSFYRGCYLLIVAPSFVFFSRQSKKKEKWCSAETFSVSRLSRGIVTTIPPDDFLMPHCSDRRDQPILHHIKNG
jgi:hypothetical protein